MSALAALVLLLAAFTGCRRHAPADTLHISCTLDAIKPAVGPAPVLVQVSDLSGHAVKTSVRLEADMSHPGMPPVFAPLEEISPGKYRGQLTFTMPGHWTLIVQAQRPGGATIEKEFPLTVLGSDAPGK